MFFLIVLLVWTGMHVYVFWRARSIPFVAHAVPRWLWVLIAVLLALSYVLARIVTRFGAETLGKVLEWVGANWIGVLFLLVVCLLAVDLITCFGFLLRDRLIPLRTAAIAVAFVLSVIALVQAIRPPVVTDYEVKLKGLPPDRNGTVVVVASDMHVGELLRKGWLKSRVDQIQALNPDLILLVGDIVEGHEKPEQELIPALKQFHAPLGVWGVTGNHEYYGGLKQCVELMEKGGVRVLRDQWKELAPGLVLAGVDDLTARTQFGDTDHFVEKTLTGIPPNSATILMSHSPWEVESAQRNRAGLMVSGHTHNGQIWPFRYLVKLRYPYVSGEYSINGMTLLVCRGTGVWGPRMRLWQRSEILRITLRS